MYLEILSSAERETELLITQGRAAVGPLGGGQVNMRKRGRANGWMEHDEGGTAVANRHLRWNFRDEKVMRKGRQLRCEPELDGALLLNCAIEGRCLSDSKTALLPSPRSPVLSEGECSTSLDCKEAELI